ncbi:hypothetical protein PL321_18375 [Caloramator sp. mosi_1]|uniref:IS66 family insertion sequence element accessory protein TnpA n=1 Tax=Caloramator sp. mosi_1 TaxID=3023090 RepID=UPI00235EDDC8|nr:hypothetical protein [Caloramator sp. mosi_1]WDC84188.1 hypothetical protein PL321_18375 [Caloramator sp. mosi_1]
MGKRMSHAKWEEYIKKFESYNGSITVKDFCIENDICKTQFYYHRKRLQKEESNNRKDIVFHAIPLAIQDEQKETAKLSKEVKITVGNVTVIIPSDEVNLISKIIKELSISC